VHLPSCAVDHLLDVRAFFCASRRRHTSSKRDWSSDVCSSDLFCFTYDFLKSIMNFIRMSCHFLHQTHEFICTILNCFFLFGNICSNFNNTFYAPPLHPTLDRKSTRLNSSHVSISYAVFCLKKK